MRIIYTFAFTLAVIFNSIEFTLQSDVNPNSERNPRPLSSSSSSFAGRQRSPDRTSPEEPSLRVRSRSPPIWPSSFKVLGYSLEQLGYIRLCPCTNPNIQFEFRKYLIPAGTQIRFREGVKNIGDVPTEESIVLSASNGDVFAVLAYSGVLRGIYRTQRHNPRVKINMMSGAIINMTPDEIRDCPVGKNHLISSKCFIVAFTEHDSLQLKMNPNSKRNPGFFSSTRQHSSDQTSPEEPSLRVRSTSPPGWPSSSKVLGYSLGQLGYIRLSPRTNPNLQFEFRRYAIPAGTKIRFREGVKNINTLPTGECIVLSTSNGEVFAILEYSGVLRGIYRKYVHNPRVKINMISGAVDNMTPDEIRDCPVGKNHPIFPTYFTEAIANYDSLETELNPKTKPNPGPFSARQHSPDRTSPQELSLCDRSKSPPGRPPTDQVLGYSLAQLGYIRLIPCMNQNRRFEFRRYVFPVDKEIQLRIGTNRFMPLPTRDYIVLSTSNGDVFAILEHTGILRGIYKNSRSHSRIKINMTSRAVEDMTADEMKECKVGAKCPIFPQAFTKVVADSDTLQTVYH